MPYGKRKMKQLESAVRTKFARALDLHTIDLDSTEEDTQDSCEDLHRLMLHLKEKLKISKAGKD